MKTLVAFSALLLALSSNATSQCERNVSDILDSYEKANIEISSYEIKTCDNVSDKLINPYGDTGKVDAPSVDSTSACLILFKDKNSPLKRIAVFDEDNDFEMYHDSSKLHYQKWGTSYLGEDKNNGTITNSVSIGNYVDDLGFLDKTYSIIRVFYDESIDTARLSKWDLGWFTNDYSHDYAIKCK